MNKWTILTKMSIAFLFYILFFWFCLGDAPNYYPNSFSGPVDNTAKLECPVHISGDVQRYNTADEDNFTQVGTFWNQVDRVWTLVNSNCV